MIFIECYLHSFQLSKVIKQLRADHRVILSGTPIQNNVLELWSLFDFLMPGFLGSEREFTARFGRPILQSRDAKSSSKEQEAGIDNKHNVGRYLKLKEVTILNTFKTFVCWMLYVGCCVLDVGSLI